MAGRNEGSCAPSWPRIDWETDGSVITVEGPARRRGKTVSKRKIENETERAERAVDADINRQLVECCNKTALGAAQQYQKDH